MRSRRPGSFGTLKGTPLSNHSSFVPLLICAKDGDAAPPLRGRPTAGRWLASSVVMRGHRGGGQQLQSDYFEREVTEGDLGERAGVLIFAVACIMRHISYVTRCASQELPDSDISEDDLSGGDAPDADEVRTSSSSSPRPPTPLIPSLLPFDSCCHRDLIQHLMMLAQVPCSRAMRNSTPPLSGPKKVTDFFWSAYSTLSNRD